MNVNKAAEYLEEFFRKNPVFTMKNFQQWYASRRTLSKRTVEALLFYHTKEGRLLHVRRGLYAVVPAGSRAETFSPDPFLLAGRMTADAVLAYHTALEFHGQAHTVTQEFLYLTKHAARAFSFRGQRFLSISVPPSLQAKKAQDFGVATADRLGLDVRVTSLERTMVDVLDRPRLGGGWEEIWRSLESIEFFNIDTVIEYTLLLDNATTVAKVGFFLEQHRKKLMVEDRQLDRLRVHRPQKPHYLSRGERKSGKLISDWNLIVPLEILEQRWGEVL